MAKKARKLSIEDSSPKKKSKVTEDDSEDGPLSEVSESDTSSEEGFVLKGGGPEGFELSSDEESENDDASDKGQNKKKKEKGKKKKYDDNKGGDGNNSNDLLDFVFRQMDESSWHGVKNLLVANPAHPPHASQLSTVITGQVALGSLLTNDDEAVFGFATILNVEDINLSRISEWEAFFKKIDNKGELLTSAFPKGVKGEVGIILLERFVNTPVALVANLIEQMDEDRKWAMKEAEGKGQGGKSEKDLYKFGALYILARMGQGEGGEKVFKNFEEEVFIKNSKVRADVSYGGENYVVGLMDMKQYSRSVNEVKEVTKDA